jgi:hypothetical protein
LNRNVATDPITKLRSAGETLDLKLRMELFALGDELVPRLIEVLRDIKCDWARLHAVDLLVDLRAMEAVWPMLDALADVREECDTTFDQILSGHIWKRLPELGAALVEPALAFVTEHWNDGGVIFGACDVLIDLEIKDPRIFKAIHRAFEAEPSLGAGMFVEYGDPRGLGVVERFILDLQPDFDHPSGRDTFADLLHCHQQLGGTFGPEVQRRHEAWLAEWDAQPEKPYEPWTPEQLDAFAQHIIEASGGGLSPEEARVCAKEIWLLAGGSEEMSDLRLQLRVKGMEEERRLGYLAIARELIGWHRAMFPELHTRR